MRSMFELFSRDKLRAGAYMIVLATFLLGAITHNQFVSLLAFTAGCIVILVQKWNPFPLLFFLFPYANIIKLGIGSASLFTYLCMFVIVWWFLRRMKVKGTFIALLLFFLSYLLLVDSSSLLVSIKLIANILLVYCFSQEMSEKTTEECALLLADGLILSLALSNVDIFFDRIIGYMRVVSFQTGTDITRSCGLFDDPNYCTLAVTATIAVLLVLYYKKKTTVLFWPRCVLLIMFGMLTYSKSFMLVMIAIVAFAVIFIFPKRSKIVMIAVLASLSIFAYFAINGQIESVNRIMERFERLELTSGRKDNSAVYIDYLRSNLKVFLVGDGITFTTIPTYDNNVHNLPLELLQRIGLIGSVFLLVTIACALPRINTRKQLVGYFPLICVAVQYLALAGLTSYALPFYIILCYASIAIV